MVRILLADDDAVMREMVARALAGDGHEVRVAADGIEALAAIEGKAGAVDILVTDVEMPGLDGVALAERALHVAPGLRVILISGYEGGMQRAAGLIARAGVRSVTKPFTLERIKAEVRAAMA